MLPVSGHAELLSEGLYITPTQINKIKPYKIKPYKTTEVIVLFLLAQ